MFLRVITLYSAGLCAWSHACDADFRVHLWDFEQEDVQKPSHSFNGPRVRRQGFQSADRITSYVLNAGQRTSVSFFGRKSLLI